MTLLRGTNIRSNIFAQRMGKRWNIDLLKSWREQEKKYICFSGEHFNTEVKVYYETTINMCFSNWQFGNVSLVALPVRRGGNGRDDENNWWGGKENVR